MKILYCLAGTFNSGGMERIVIDKANWLAQHGYDITIATTEQNGRSDFYRIDGNIKRIDLDVIYSDTNGFNVINKFFARRKKLKQHHQKLQRLVDEIQPDIIVSTFGNEVGIMPYIKTSAHKIAEIHFSRWYRLQLNRKGIWRLIDKLLTHKDYQVLQKYDKFVCLTEEDKKNWIGVNNCIVIPNFVNNLSEHLASLTNKSMIAVGRLCYQKGYDRLINAWNIVNKSKPDWKLNIFGDGELKYDLIKLIEQNNLTNVVKIHVPTSDIIDEYMKHSALVLSSRYEGLPMVLLEAGACGLPLISFGCQCGPKDVIVDRHNGLIVPEGDTNGLAKAIIATIENEDLRYSMGRNAYETAKTYTKDNIMNMWDTLFKTFCHGS